MVCLTKYIYEKVEKDSVVTGGKMTQEIKDRLGRDNNNKE